jgi:hypothetical protein
LVCSGDFIDRGKVENFLHTKEVLDHLAFKFNIQKDNIILSIGNHDLKVINSKKADYSAYKLFSDGYGPSNTVAHSNIYRIVEYPNKVYVLELNSILNTSEEISTNPANIHVINPSNIDDKDIDDVVTAVERVVKDPNLIIVVTHFPMSINNRMSIITEESDWVKKHLWVHGKEIMQRITNNRISNNIICLYGDGHNDNYWSASENHHYFMTCMGC